MLNEEKLIRFDYAMKYMLRDKVNFDILEAFLTALLKEDITVLEILKSESNQEEEKLKFNRVDLLVKDTNNQRIIIEIQNQRELDYLQRLLWGSSKVIVENLELGKPFKDVVKSKNIKEAENKLKVFKMTKEQRKSYEKYLLNLVSETDAFNTAKEEGRQEGREEGRREGFYEIARNMLGLGIDSSTIASATGLTEHEIDKIRKSFTIN